MLDTDRTDIREERHHITQEDFTPQTVVNDMLARFPEEAFTDFSKTILDPSCGIGNFLVAILERRLEHCNDIDDAISSMKTLYGVELMADNVEECRNRLYNVVINRFQSILNDKMQNYKLRSIIRNRIQWGNSLEFDYNHWRTLDLIPRPKHENISFHEKKGEDDDCYPMWHKREPEQLSLFD